MSLPLRPQLHYGRDATTHWERGGGRLVQSHPLAGQWRCLSGRRPSKQERSLSHQSRRETFLIKAGEKLFYQSKKLIKAGEETHLIKAGEKHISSKPERKPSPSKQERNLFHQSRRETYFFTTGEKPISSKQERNISHKNRRETYFIKAGEKPISSQQERNHQALV